MAGSGALADLLDKSMGDQLPDTGPGGGFSQLLLIRDFPTTGCTFLLKYFKYCTGIGIVRERRSRAAPLDVILPFATPSTFHAIECLSIDCIDLID